MVDDNVGRPDETALRTARTLNPAPTAPILDKLPGTSAKL